MNNNILGRNIKLCVSQFMQISIRDQKEPYVGSRLFHSCSFLGSYTFLRSIQYGPLLGTEYWIRWTSGLTQSGNSYVPNSRAKAHGLSPSLVNIERCYHLMAVQRHI